MISTKNHPTHLTERSDKSMQGGLSRRVARDGGLRFHGVLNAPHLLRVDRRRAKLDRAGPRAKRSALTLKANYSARTTLQHPWGIGVPSGTSTAKARGRRVVRFLNRQSGSQMHWRAAASCVQEPSLVAELELHRYRVPTS